MSERNSTPSPTSGSASDSDDTANDDLTADLDLGFDGAEDMLRAWAKGTRPDPDLTVSDWADAHRWVTLPNGDRVSPAQAGWSNADGFTLSEVAEPVPALPTPEEALASLRASMPPLSRHQVFIGLVASGLATAPEVLAISATGTVPATIEAAFAGMPEPQQSYARITFAEFTVAERLDPTTLLLQAVGGLSDAALDAFFVEFAQV